MNMFFSFWNNVLIYFLITFANDSAFAYYQCKQIAQRKENNGNGLSGHLVLYHYRVYI